jgi:hypothetical protein
MFINHRASLHTNVVAVSREGPKIKVEALSQLGIAGEYVGLPHLKVISAIVQINGGAAESAEKVGVCFSADLNDGRVFSPGLLLGLYISPRKRNYILVRRTEICCEIEFADLNRELTQRGHATICAAGGLHPHLFDLIGRGKGGK